MASGQGQGQEQGAEQAGLRLLQAVLRCDLPALQAELREARAVLTYRGLGALHVAAFADWGEAVKLLVAAGAPVNGTTKVWSPIDTLAERLAPVGLTAEQISKLGQLYDQKPALLLAVSVGAAKATGALAAAGASTLGAFGQLQKLAQSLVAGLEGGQLAAAATAVPATVQQLAEALLASGLPPGPYAVEAHKAAVSLAHPRRIPGHPARGDTYPPCPWLLDRLLHMHSTGQLGEAAAAEYGPAVAKLVEELVSPLFAGVRWDDDSGKAAVEAEAVQWLRVTSATGLAIGSLVGIGEALVGQGMVDTALPLLLGRQEVQQALQQDSQQLPRCDGFGSFQLAYGDASRMVVAAAVAGRAEVLDTVLAAGGSVGLKAVVHLANQGCHDKDLQALELLLSRGVPQVPAEVPHFTACPVYALLDAQHMEQELVMETIYCCVCDGYAPSDEHLQELHLRQLRGMDLLAQAGYRPVTFCNYRVQRDGKEVLLPEYFPPAELAKKWELDSSNRWLWRAALREPWSPATHASFPPAFKAAARTLLLVANRCTGAGLLASGAPAATAEQAVPSTLRRGRSRTASSKSAASTRGGNSASVAIAAQLGALPAAVLHSVLAQAAYPLSTWEPAMQGGENLAGVESMKVERTEEMAMGGFYCDD